MSLHWSPHRIRFLRSHPFTSYSMQNWGSSNYWVLFVTGLSGSGKTRAIKELQKQYGCPAISLDALRFYDSASYSSRKVVDQFLAINPSIQQLVDNHWDYRMSNVDGEKEYEKYTQLLIKFISELASTQSQKIIVEGIQLFVRMPPDSLENCPKIVIGTSAIKSFLQATKRDFPVLHINNLPRVLHRFMKYSVIQWFRLNRYISFWELHENPIIYYQ